VRTYVTPFYNDVEGLRVVIIQHFSGTPIIIDKVVKIEITGDIDVDTKIICKIIEEKVNPITNLAIALIMTTDLLLGE
jgi:hypothetical protein